LKTDPVLIRRRHVLFVEGFDPQGAEGYYRIFQHARKRTDDIWQCQGKTGEPQFESELIARWDVEAAGPNWKVATHYEFLRLEHIIRAEMGAPITRHVPRTLAWILDYLITGTTWRMLRAAWRFTLHVLYFEVVLLLWLALAAGLGWLVARTAARLFALPAPVALAVGILTGIACVVMLRPVVHRLRAVQGNSCWALLSSFARGREPRLDAVVEAGAARLVAAARAAEMDEVVIIGHSWGASIAAAVVARALERDPDVGRRGPRIVLLTLGSIMAAAALHPAAARLHSAIRRLAAEPSIRWLECQARRDVLSCWMVDPVEASGIDLGGGRHNPLLWQVRLRDLVSAERYGRLRWKFLRVHYQFIMGNDRRAPYDYVMVTCGPIPVEEWAARGRDLVPAFASDGAYIPGSAYFSG